MKNLKYVASASFIIIFSLVMFCIFNMVPGGRIWDDYSVLYVSKEVPESSVLAVLNENGVSDVISKSSQTVPFVSSVTPVIPEKMNEYLKIRLNYFSDRSGRYNLFYIQTRYGRGLAAALEKIQATASSDSGIDSTGSYPAVVPVLCTLLFLVFLYFSENKGTFFSASFMLLIFSFSVPLYECGCAVMLFLSFIFVSQRLWKRKGAVVKIRRNFNTRLLFVSAVFVLLFNSIGAALLGILAMASSISLLYLYVKFYNWKESKFSFNYEPIISAGFISIVSRRILDRLLISSLFMAVLFIFFLMNVSFGNISTSSKVYLPSPVSEKKADKDLPSDTDYYDWAWNTVSFPYRNLNHNSVESEPHKGERLSVPSYENSSTGIITYNKYVIEYNDEFIASMKGQVEKNNAPLIENLILNQKEGFHAGYSSSDSKNTNSHFKWSLILIIISVIVIPLLWVKHYLSGRNK